jgi:anti-sigma B factor antagonist
MQVTISNDTGPTAKVMLVGRLDIAGAEVVALPLATLAGGKTNIIVDMSGVTFVSSIGIRQLVLASNEISRRGGKLVLVNPIDIVRDVFVTSDLSDLLPMVATESEAYALLG